MSVITIDEIHLCNHPRMFQNHMFWNASEAVLAVVSTEQFSWQDSAGIFERLPTEPTILEIYARVELGLP